MDFKVGSSTCVWGIQVVACAFTRVWYLRTDTFLEWVQTSSSARIMSPEASPGLLTEQRAMALRDRDPVGSAKRSDSKRVRCVHVENDSRVRSAVRSRFNVSVRTLSQGGRDLIGWRAAYGRTQKNNETWVRVDGHTTSEFVTKASETVRCRHLQPSCCYA